MSPPDPAGTARSRIAALLDLPESAITGIAEVAGGDICRAWRVSTPTDRAFVKEAPPGSPGMIAAEVAGLVWLAEGGAEVPQVLGASDTMLALRWFEPAPPSALAARRFGRALATVHSAGADWFGQAPPDAPANGWVGRVRMPYTCDDDWPRFYAEARVAPLLAEARARGLLGHSDADAIAALLDRMPDLAGPPVPPARIHGDLWGGNVLWADDAARMIDPAAHGGHPLTDLAMLHLFGCPHLPDIVDGYQTLTPLPPGWERRMPLHQVYPLLVHVVLFGAGYVPRLRSAVRDALRP